MYSDGVFHLQDESQQILVKGFVVHLKNCQVIDRIVYYSDKALWIKWSSLHFFLNVQLELREYKNYYEFHDLRNLNFNIKHGRK